MSLAWHTSGTSLIFGTHMIPQVHQALHLVHGTSFSVTLKHKTNKAERKGKLRKEL